MSKLASGIAALPQWLHVRIDPQIPERWHFIAELFGAAALHIIGNAIPVRAVLRLKKASHGMEVKFVVGPSLPSEKCVALKELADLVSALANALRRQEHEDEARAAAQTIEDLLREPTGAPDAQLGDSTREETTDHLPHVQVFRWNESVLAGGVDRGRDADGAGRIARTLKRLKGTGAERPLCAPPAGWAQLADDLVTEFPNFATVVSTLVRPHVALSALGIRSRLAPMLLVGPPGIGKTAFARSVAQLLNVPPPLVISVAAETNGSAIGGSSTFWANASPGRIFESMAWGERGGQAVADGLVILDEVDKVAGDSRYEPLGALYALLEADTARSFQDQSLPDVVVDASHLRIICTANDLHQIPLPLRSRMIVFQIDSPSREQARRIVSSMFRAAIRQMGIAMDPELPPDVIEEAAGLEPRRARLLLEAAVARALAREQTCLEVSDWQAVHKAGASVQPRSIGFMG
jgi:hypothetical protein